MTIKILETHSPIIATYPHHASLFSIIEDDPRALSWIFHNYLLLFLHHDEQGEYGIDFCSQYFPWHQLKFSSCPLILCRNYDTEILLKNSKLSDLIISLIDTESYVYFFRDIGNNNRHEVLVSGYDLSSQTFLCHDFWDDVFSEKWIPFNEIQTATTKVSHAEWAVDYLNGIWTLQKNPKYKNKDEFYYETVLNFNKEDLIHCLREYLGYENNVRQVLKKDNRIVGIDIYDTMINMLEQQKNNPINLPFTPHPFQVLYEHKKLMVFAIENFVDTYTHLETAKLLVEESKKLRNIVIYCNLSLASKQVYKRYDSIIESIKILKNLELDLFNALIKEYNNI